VVRPKTRRGPYLLSSLVLCGLCGRRMQGSWNHGRAYYRCKFPVEYAIAAEAHPRTVYVREAAMVPALDGWLATIFDPEHLDATTEALAAASEPDDGAVARREAARRRVDDCDARLARYRAALEAGADPVVVAGWIAEVEGERLGAERELGATVPQEKLTKGQVRALVKGLRDVVRALAQADPEDKAAIYAELGIRLTYHPGGRVVVESRPCTEERVGGGT
jgi:site-specific DNA recombinase